MARPDVNELLESAAPTPRTALDIGHIEHRIRHRRRRRRVVSTIACVSVVGLFVGLAVTLPNSGEPKTVVAGPPASRPFPVEFGAGAATTEIRLLDGTRLRVTVPEAVGNGLAGATFANFELHGSVYAGPAPRGWAIDVVVGSIHNLVPGGEPIVVPSSSPFSAALVDQPGHRLGLQFGAWALVASGDSLTDADIDVLVAGLALADSPDGFVEYRGSLALWPADAPDARLGGPHAAVSVFLDDNCPVTLVPRRTAGGLESYRSDDTRNATELCDPVNRLRLWFNLETSQPSTDEDIDRVRVEVLSVGPTLAAIQRGEHP